MSTYKITVELDNPDGKLSLADIDHIQYGIRWVIKDCGAVAGNLTWDGPYDEPVKETCPLVVGYQERFDVV